MLLDPRLSLLLVVDVQEKLVPAMSEKDELVKNCSILLQAASLAGVPVLVSEQYPAGLGATLPEITTQHADLKRFPKVEFSCARNEDLKRAIDSAAGSQMIICGVEAHVCVTQTAIDLKKAGKDVFVVTDATASRQRSSKDVAMQRLSASGISVVTAEMVVFEWAGTAAAPTFKQLSKLVR